MRTPHFLVPSYLMVLVLLTGTVVNGSPAVSSMVHAQSCEIKATWYDDPAQEDTRGVISQNTGLGQSFTIPATSARYSSHPSASIFVPRTPRRR